MHSVFLVEDEVVVREGIRNLVSWEDYGFSFIGEASDGELAWPLIQEQKPDIVITDIKMPFMDGLQLSKLIKQEFPETIVVILSGHDDFSYARDAISIGVNQFLLKPISKSQMAEALVELKQKLDEEVSRRQYAAKFALEIQEYLLASRRDFFDALLAGELSATELLDQGKAQGLSLTAERYNIVLFLLEEDIAAGYSSPAADVQDRITKTFSNAEDILIFSAGMDVMAFLVQAKQDEIDDRTQRCVDEINKICERTEHTAHWAVVTGEPVSQLNAVAMCYRAARRRLFHYPEHTSVVADNGNIWAGAAPVDFDPDKLDTDKMDSRIIEKFLSGGLPEDVGAFVEDYFNGFSEEALQSVAFRQYVLLNVRFAVSAFLKRIGARKEKTGGEDVQKEVEQALRSVKSSKHYISDLVKETLVTRDKIVTKRRRGILANVIAYIDEHYADPEIKLNTVAKIANVAPTHFSTLFSQQMEKTFVEYLTELRMGKARELLRYTRDGSGEIALKVGYNDPHYFSFLFKKINGCSPREYRNKNSARE